MSHTPGPWFYDESSRTHITINALSVSVASVPYCDAEGRADARLIAAAPDLLAMLQEFIACGRDAADNEELIAAARFVIAKATQS